MEMIELKSKVITVELLLPQLNSRVEMTEDRLNELEDRSMESAQSEKQKIDWEKKKKADLQDVWNSNKRSNICIMGILEGKM